MLKPLSQNVDVVKVVKVVKRVPGLGRRYVLNVDVGKLADLRRNVGKMLTCLAKISLTACGRRMFIEIKNAVCLGSECHM